MSEGPLTAEQIMKAADEVRLAMSAMAPALQAAVLCDLVAHYAAGVRVENRPIATEMAQAATLKTIFDGAARILPLANERVSAHLRNVGTRQ